MDGDLYLCDVFVPLQQVVGCGNLECIFSGWQIGVRCLQDTIADGCVPLSACEGVHPLFVDSFQLVAVIGTFTVHVVQCRTFEGQKVLVVVQFYLRGIRSSLGQDDAVSVPFSGVDFLTI